MDPTKLPPLDPNVLRLHEARQALYPKLGRAVAAIGDLEHTLDALIGEIFDGEIGTWQALRELDFRAKTRMLEGWIEVVENNTDINDVKKRLNGLYDSRNIVAHGYIRWVDDQIVLHHPRTKSQMSTEELIRFTGKVIALEVDLMTAYETIRDLNRRRKAQEPAKRNVLLGLAESIGRTLSEE